MKRIFFMIGVGILSIAGISNAWDAATHQRMTANTK